MDNVFKNAKWIWCNSTAGSDEYGEFVDFFSYDNGKVLLRISADSNYATYINGELAAWGQYADFPYDKVYDEVDITAFCKKGKNRIATIVWYYGVESSTYYLGNAGLLYEVVCDRQILCESDASTLSRMSKAYMNHRGKLITGQMGLGYGYDFSKEDGWLSGELTDFAPATVTDANPPLRIRPCDKLTLLPEVPATECKRISDTRVIYDLGREQVGFLSFEITSPCEQDIRIFYGEHLVDGCVRGLIDERDFSVVFHLVKGTNCFFNPFRRFGLRYLEVHSTEQLEVKKLAIAPTMYVLEEKERPVLSEKQNQIYDMCIETLRLCMHEHYEDCPWREQAFYTMDSRNQMLCGYYAFGEYKFPRSGLQLISKDNREDGLLSICYPMSIDYVIPSFSMHYIVECREYMQYSGDTAFLSEIYPKLVSIVETFTNHMTDGLVLPFEGKRYWNFYEWRTGLSGADVDCSKPDLILNTLLSIALRDLGVIADELGIANDYAEQANVLNAKITEIFCNPANGLYYDLADYSTYSQLGNSLAILCGATTEASSERICERLLNDTNMTPISLSMQCFKYDAWLATDKEKYAPIILEDIEHIYTPMIEFGSTTVWETDLGESDFANAGSLCHGWSALPIYYYRILKK